MSAYRVTRAWSIDDVAQPARDRLAVWLTAGGRFRRYLLPLADHGDGQACPYCTGWHLSWMTYAAACLVLRRRRPIVVHLIEAWAVAGAQAILSALDGHLVSPTVVESKREADQ